jgi:modification methylase
MNRDETVNRFICGNTLEELKKIKDSTIGVGVTSPPYNKQENKNKGWLVANVVYDKYKDSMNEDDYQKNQIEVLNELFRITKEGGSFFYNHKVRWEKGKMIHPMTWLSKTDWTIRQEIIWDRGIAANIRGWRFWQVEERIYWLYKPVGKNLIGKELESKDALLTSIWRIRPESQKRHPAPFPVELPLRCLLSVASPNDIVIDPYCGSGTTLVAAKKLGLQYIGIDISENYINSAKERLENYESENEKMNNEIAKHVVSKTFKQRKREKNYANKYGIKLEDDNE